MKGESAFMKAGIMATFIGVGAGAGYGIGGGIVNFGAVAKEVIPPIVKAAANGSTQAVTNFAVTQISNKLLQIAQNEGEMVNNSQGGADGKINPYTDNNLVYNLIDACFAMDWEGCSRYLPNLIEWPSGGAKAEGFMAMGIGGNDFDRRVKFGPYIYRVYITNFLEIVPPQGEHALTIGYYNINKNLGNIQVGNSGYKEGGFVATTFNGRYATSGSRVMAITIDRSDPNFDNKYKYLKSKVIEIQDTYIKGSLKD